MYLEQSRVSHLIVKVFLFKKEKCQRAKKTRPITLHSDSLLHSIESLVLYQYFIRHIYYYALWHWRNVFAVKSAAANSTSVRCKNPCSFAGLSTAWSCGGEVESKFCIRKLDCNRKFSKLLTATFSAIPLLLKALKIFHFQIQWEFTTYRMCFDQVDISNDDN